MILFSFIPGPGARSFLLYGIVKPAQLWLATFVFTGIITGLVIYILVYLFRHSRRAANRTRLRKHFSEFISLLAICDSEEELKEVMEGPSFKSYPGKWLSHSYPRYILIKELVTLARNMSGSARDNICWFYNQAGLDKDTLEKLKTGKWHIRAKAIQTLSQLDQKQHMDHIYRFTNDKNELVRNEARIAVVKLTGFEGLRFLDMISFPLTEWEQLYLLHELSKQSETSFKDIHRWLQSPNHSVVEFALRLTEVYKVFELHDEVIQCLRHPVKSIRKRAILALREIYSAGTAELLINQFDREDVDMQLSILRLLQQAGTENEIPFLSKKLLDRRDDFKMAAARAIRTIKADGLKLVEQAINVNMQPWPVLLPQLQQEDPS